MIRFTCACGKQLQAREENAGRSVACPSCGRQLTVPDASEDAIRTGDSARPPEVGAERIQPGRSKRAEEDDDRERLPATGTSGKAIVSLVLGLLTLLCNLLAAIPAVILGILALRDIERSRGRLSGRGLAISGIVSACIATVVSCTAGSMIGLLLPAVQKVREAAARVQSQNNLKQLSMAMLSYHDQNFRFPAAAIVDKTNKPLLSWRVALLPQLGQKALYDQFKLDEPWDGPNNIKLLSRMPPVYHCAAASTPPDQTVYQVFVGNGAAFEKTEARRLADMQDGTTNIIMIVEARQPVPWTKPEDLPFDPNQPLPPLGVASSNGFNAAAVDGAVHFIPKSTPERTLHLLIQRNDGQAANFP
jgi:hypothetical protein